ncbi:hypothetical protein ACFVTY_06900 [Streptomyces sp. NPDC058067]|uniref:hypothetical protein n=1 Tax=Streptomyces sp. NPDC058067 TaxID=3346324 RepID=UPI0036EBE67E
MHLDLGFEDGESSLFGLPGFNLYDAMASGRDGELLRHTIARYRAHLDRSAPAASRRTPVSP